MPARIGRCGVKILAFDTSTELCSCALARDGEIIYRERHAKQSHSQILLPMIDELLAKNDVSLVALDAIAYGCGPGSFTGLRIACGVAQGLALGADLPVIGINSLLALSEASGAAKAIACMDARMGEIYHAAYERSHDDWICVAAPSLRRPEHAPLVPGDGWSACGSGFAIHGETLARRYGAQLSSVRADLLPRALEIARLAVRGLARGEATGAAGAIPLYVRDKVALKSNER